MEALKLLAPLAWRNLWRNPRRTVVTLIVIVAGVYSIVTFAALIVAWGDSIKYRTLSLLTGSAQIHAEGYLDDPQIAFRFPAPSGALLDALNDPAIRGYAPRLATEAVVQSEYKTMPVMLTGVDPLAEQAISDLPGNIVEGSYLSGPDDEGIVLGQKLAKRLNTRLSKRVILMAQSADGVLAERSFTVTGIYGRNAELEDIFAFTGLGAMRSYIGTGDELTEISFLMEDEIALDRVVGAIRQAAPGLDTRRWNELSPMAAAMEDTMGISIAIVLWIMFVLMAIGIVNTQLMAVFERVREFGLLQALGMRPRSILLLVLLESAILSGIGTVIGVIGAVLTILSLHQGIDISAFAEGSAMVGAGNTIIPELDMAQAMELAVIVWALSVLVAIWPAGKAAKSSPVEAMTHVS